MTTAKIISFLQEEFGNDKPFFLKEENYPHNHLMFVRTEWGAYRKLSFGVEYYIFPHILVESFPAQIEFDWSEKNSQIQGVVEKGGLEIAKIYGSNEEGMNWAIFYNDIVGLEAETFEGVVHKMNTWLKENEYKILIP